MIVFNRVKSLASNITRERIYGGEYGASTSALEELTVNGYLYDIACTSGIGNVILSGIYALDTITKSSIDAIEINGIIYGSGYVSQFNVEPGNWTRTANYSAKVNIRRSGDFVIPGFGPQASKWVKSINREHVEKCDEYDDCPRGEVSNKSTVTYYEDTPAGIGAPLADGLSITNFSCGNAGQAIEENKNWIKLKSESQDIFKKVFSEEIKWVTVDCPVSGSLCSGDNLDITSASYSASLSEDGTQNSSYSLRIAKNTGDIASPGSSSAPILSSGCKDELKNPENPISFGQFLAAYGYGDPGQQVGEGYGEDSRFWTIEASFQNDGLVAGVGPSGITPDPDCFYFKSWNKRANDDGSKSATVTWRGERGESAVNGDSNKICGLNLLPAAQSDALAMVGEAETPEEAAQNPEQCQDDPNNTTSEKKTEIDSLSLSVNEKDGSVTASATAISYYLEEENEDGAGATVNPEEDYVEQTISRDETPRDEFKYIVMANGGSRQIKYNQKSKGIKTLTTTRKYKKANITEVEYPSMPDAGTPFVISKTFRKSSNSSSAEISWYYH